MVAHDTDKMSMEGVIKPVVGVQAKLHSKNHKDIGKAWAIEWLYPKNELFDTSKWPARLTLFNPDKLYDARRGEYITQDTIDSNGDRTYILNAQVRHNDYGTMRAYYVQITGEVDNVAGT